MPTPTDDALVHERREGAVLVLSINRPKALNALNPAVLEALAAALDRAEADVEVRAVVLTGEGDKAFVAGADIGAMADLSPEQAYQFARTGGGVLERIEAMGKPVVAAVNGFALGGGCELSLACDVIFASTKARFGQPEVKLGVIPGFGGTQRLARLIGRNAAKMWVMSGDMYGAEEALRVGLVQAVCEPEDLLPRAIALCNTMARQAPLAVAAAKRAVNAGVEEPLASALDLEARAFGELFHSADQLEGMSAFLGKRAPAWTGK